MDNFDNHIYELIPSGMIQKPWQMGYFVKPRSEPQHFRIKGMFSDKLDAESAIKAHNDLVEQLG